ncbi:hypothetical protein DFJ77DRAFT_43637 [Powellomyces hirtus]|nr:hypothetical protein DFJ77DRAFT_43637 [Powellomyces hirtus]
MFSPLAKRTSRVSARTSPPVSPTPLSRRSSQASPTGDHQQPPPPAPSSTVTSLWDRINAVTKKTAQARLSTTEGTPHLEPRSTLGSAESAMRARAKTPEIHDPPLSRTGITPHTKEPTRDDRSTHDSNILHSQSRHTRREAEAEPASSAERNPRSRTETPEQSSRARQPQPVNDSPLLSHRRSTPTMSPHLNHKPESATPRERPASTTARSIQAEPLDGLSPAIASAPRFREVSAGIDVSALRERLVQEGPKWVNQQQHHIPRADAAHSTATSASRSRVPSSSSAHSVPASTSAAPPHIPMDIKKSSTDAAAAGVSVQQPTFQHQMLENVINDCLDEFRIQLRADVQNVHLDMMRQFWFQKVSWA